MTKRTVLALLFTLLSSMFHHSTYALEWSLEIESHSDHSFAKGYHGCGTLMGKFEEKNMSPEVIAEKYCTFWDEYHSCIRNLDHPAHAGGPPSIFDEIVEKDTTYYTGYEYRFQCTNSGVGGSYLGIVYASVSKGTLGAGDNPKNNGPSCPYCGNPINPMNGNKYQNEAVYNGVNSLAFNMAYNSNYNTEKKQLGTAWRSPFDRALSADVFDELGLVAMSRQSGKGFDFKDVNGTLVADFDKTYSLIQLTDSQGETTGWRFDNEIGGEVELYDANGQLLSVTDRAGLTQTLTYSTASTPANIAPEAGLLIQVSDNVGRSLHFTYDTANRVASMTDPAGAVYAYAYNDDNNNLVSVTYPDNTVKIYHYGGDASEAANIPADTNRSFDHALTGITDENGGRFATWTYDTRGRAISSEHAGGVEKFTLEYFANGSGSSHPLYTDVTEVGTGTVRRYNIVSTAILGVLKSKGQSQPAGPGYSASALALTYDVNGNIASSDDFNGNQTTYIYDMARNLETSRTEGLTTTGAATAATRTVATTWHATWRLPLTISEYTGTTATGTALKTTTYVYDDKGNITSLSIADPVNNKTRTTTSTYTYSTAVPGLMLSRVVDGPRTDVSDVTTYTYYPHDATCTPSSATPIIDPITSIAPDNLGCRGQLQSVSNALNQTTSYDRYNHHGQVEQMTDANGLITTSTYDLRQRITNRTVGTEVTNFQYDNVGQLTQLTLPDNSTLAYTYDAAHRLTDIQDSLGNKVHYTLDTEGNRISEDTTDPTNQLTKTLSRSYDALNRLQQVTGLE